MAFAVGDGIRLRGEVAESCMSGWPMLPTLRSELRGLRHCCLFSLYHYMFQKMLLGLTEPLPSLVKAKFKAAKATSSLLFSPTELSIIRTSAGIPASTWTIATCAFTRTNNLTVPTTVLPLSRKETHSQTRSAHLTT